MPQVLKLSYKNNDNLLAIFSLELYEQTLVKLVQCFRRNVITLSYLYLFNFSTLNFSTNTPPFSSSSDTFRPAKYTIGRRIGLNRLYQAQFDDGQQGKFG